MSPQAPGHLGIHELSTIVLPTWLQGSSNYTVSLVGNLGTNMVFIRPLQVIPLHSLHVNRGINDYASSAMGTQEVKWELSPDLRSGS